MASLTRHNTKNPGVKRILQEAKEIANDPSPDLTAAPLEVSFCIAFLLLSKGIDVAWAFRMIYFNGISPLKFLIPTLKEESITVVSWYV